MACWSSDDMESAITGFGNSLDLTLDVSLYLEPIIHFGFMVFVSSTTNVLYHIAGKVVKLLINDKIPNLNRPSLVMSWAVLGHGITLRSRGCQ